MDDGVSQVDFEIALCALLSALVLNYPINHGLYSYVEILGVGVLAVTLIRRMMLKQGTTSNPSILRFSTYILLFLTLVLLMYTFLVFSVYVSGLTKNIILEVELIETFWVVTSASALLIALFMELIIGGFLKEGSAIFDDHYKEKRNPATRTFTKMMSRFSAKKSTTIEHTQTKATEYGDTYSEDLTEEERLERGLQLLKNWIATLTGVILVVLTYFLLIRLASSYYQIPYWSAFVTLLSLNLVYGLLEILLSKYGLVDLTKLGGRKKFVFVIVPSYLLVCSLIYTF